VETAVETPELSTLVSVLTTAAYKPVLDALSGPGPFTVFAPSNDAFAAAIAAGLNTTQVALVTQTLYYHVLSGRVMSTDLKPLQFPTTVMNASDYVTLGGKGQVLAVSKSTSGVTINFGIPGVGDFTANVSIADVNCSNGVVHIIDKVLMFPKLVSETAVAAPGNILSELVAALVKAGLVEAVNTAASVTIFAPTNDAMKAANWSSLSVADLAKVLKYHVVTAVARSTDLADGLVVPTLLDGQKLTININGTVVLVNKDSKVYVPNVLVKNGVVHVIDKVLIPPAATPTAKPTPQPSKETSAASSAAVSTLAVLLFAAVYA